MAGTKKASEKQKRREERLRPNREEREKLLGDVLAEAAKQAFPKGHVEGLLHLDNLKDEDAVFVLRKAIGDLKWRLIKKPAKPMPADAPAKDNYTVTLTGKNGNAVWTVLKPVPTAVKTYYRETPTRTSFICASCCNSYHRRGEKDFSHSAGTIDPPNESTRVWDCDCKTEYTSHVKYPEGWLIAEGHYEGSWAPLKDLDA